MVEARTGLPALAKGTREKDAGLLRVDYPGYRGKATLQEISWDDFFEKFDREALAFLCQERTATGRESRFNKLVPPRG